MKELSMPDLDQIKQREQGAGDWRERLPRASRARPRDRRDRVNRDEGGNGMRFASDSLQITARPAGGRNGLDRLASHQLEQISINLAVSLRGALRATTQLDRSSVRRLKVAFAVAKEARWFKAAKAELGPPFQRSAGGSVDPGFRRESPVAAVSSRMGLRCACGPCRHSP